MPPPATRQPDSVYAALLTGGAGYRRGEELRSCLSRARATLSESRESGCSTVLIGAYRGLTLVN